MLIKTGKKLKISQKNLRNAENKPKTRFKSEKKSKKVQVF
jgi:hypothetical protein